MGNLYINSLKLKLVLTTGTLLLLIFISQWFRFERRWIVSYDGETIRSELDGQVLSTKASLNYTRLVRAVLHRSALEESVISELKLLDSDGSHLQAIRYRFVYLAGRILYGRALWGAYRGFEYSTGDWTFRRDESDEFDLFKGPLPARFTIELGIVGRGGATLILHGAERITVNFRDGLIDSDTSICTARGCPVTSYLNKPVAVSLRQIADFWLQFVLAGVFALFVVQLCCYLSGTVSIPSKEFSGRTCFAIAALLALLHFGYAFWFSFKVIGGIPHIPDSAMYYRQAILLSKGEISIPSPPLAEPSLILPHDASIKNGRIFFNHGTHFWPALLALGIIINAPAVINPFFSALSLFFLVLIAAKLFSQPIGIATGILYLISPFSTVMSGDYMMHTSCQLFIILTLYCWLNESQKMKLLSGLFAGVAIGIRAYSGSVILGTVILLSVAFNLVKLSRRAMFDFFLGLTTPIALLLFDHWIITGSPFSSPYSAIHLLTPSFGRLREGLTAVNANIGHLPPLVSFYPWLLLGLVGYALLSFADKRLWWIFAPFPCLLVAHAFVPVHGLHGYGPRFFFEGLFALYIPAAWAVVHIVNTFKGQPRARAFLLSLCLIGTLHSLWTLARLLRKYEHYNGIDTNLFKAIKQVSSENPIIIVNGLAWQGMGISATLFDPQFKGTLFVNDRGDGGYRAVMDAYPERRVYRVEGKGLRVMR